MMRTHRLMKQLDVIDRYNIVPPLGTYTTRAIPLRFNYPPPAFKSRHLSLAINELGELDTSLPSTARPNPTAGSSPGPAAAAVEHGSGLVLAQVEADGKSHAMNRAPVCGAADCAVSTATVTGSRVRSSAHASSQGTEPAYQRTVPLRKRPWSVSVVVSLRSTFNSRLSAGLRSRRTPSR